jgi:hypothetical protein
VEITYQRPPWLSGSHHPRHGYVCLGPLCAEPDLSALVELAATALALGAAARLGLGRIVALYHRSSTLHQIHEHIRFLLF